MVQLSPSPIRQLNSRAECPVMGYPPETDSPKTVSPGDLSALQLDLEVSTAYHGYDAYLEDGLLCLKHKIRNMEKRKLKLEDYIKRVQDGGTLNKDQMGAVGQYQELLHNLVFAQELHCNLDGLTQNLLQAHIKAAEKEQLLKVEEERRRLSMVLRFQHLLSGLQKEHIRGDLLAGRAPAPLVSRQQLASLTELSGLLGLGQRNRKLSVAKQMEKAAMMYFDLLDAKHKPVAGSTFKDLKEQLTDFLDCKYFDVLPPAPSRSPVVSPAPPSLTAKVLQPNTKEMENKSLGRPQPIVKQTPPPPDLKAEFQAMKEREPPYSWDAEFLSETPSVRKPWRGAATIIPKGPQTDRPSRKKGKKVKKRQGVKKAALVDAPLEVFNSPCALPNDPVQRKQQLEDLILKIHGSYSFMQESLLETESSPSAGLARSASGSPPLLAAQDPVRSPVEVPTTMQSTPLPARRVDASLRPCDLSFATRASSNDSLQLDEQPLASPPLYRRTSVLSVSLEDPRTPVMDSGKQSLPLHSSVSLPPQTPVMDSGKQSHFKGGSGPQFSTPPARRTLAPELFQSGQSVFKVSGSVSPTAEMTYKPRSRYHSASTQTPPEFAPPDDESQSPYQSDYQVENSSQVFLSPSQPGHSAGRPYHSRAHTRGPSFVPGVPHREPGPLLYNSRESGFHGYIRGGAARHNSSGWSDSSQVSSPDRDGIYPIMDSGHGDSLSVSTLEVPVTPHHHHHHHHPHPQHQPALLPVPLYPLTPPVRVAFTASRTANFAPGNLDQPIVFDQLHTNVGETYDARVGRFTCPAAGAYVFLFHILKLAVNVPLYVNLMCNDEVMVSAYANDGAPDHETASNHAILPLFPGDQIWLRLHRGAIYGSTWKYSTFSGFLLYQD